MIIRRVGSKNRFRRKCTSCIGNLAPNASSTDLKTIRVSQSTANETDKSGKKKSDENRDSCQQGAFLQNSFPQTKEHHQICPEEKLGIVPLPWGEPDKAAGQKDENRWKK